MPYCPNCEAVVAEAAASCDSCGASFVGEGSWRPTATRGVSPEARPYQVPWRAFVLLALVPLVGMILIFLADLLGAEPNPHGGAGILLLLIMLWSLGTAVAYLFMVPRALVALANDPPLRTRKNVLSLTVAVSFLALVAFY